MPEQLLPQHIGIILDGNRRWAKEHNLPSFEGHRRGFENIKTIASHAFDQGIKIMTVFAFSVENWKRSVEEVGYLMDLFNQVAIQELKFLTDQNIKLQILGDLSALNPELQNNLNKAIQDTANNTNGIFNICLNYGGREDIVRAVKKIISLNTAAEAVTPELLQNHLYTAGLVDPDLIIRTSGEQRLSGFLTWQSIYSELYFVNKHWPDFSKEDLDEALKVFATRSRRFGGN